MIVTHCSQSRGMSSKRERAERGENEKEQDPEGGPMYPSLYTVS